MLPVRTPDKKILRRPSRIVESPFAIYAEAPLPSEVRLERGCPLHHQVVLGPIQHPALSTVRVMGTDVARISMEPAVSQKTRDAVHPGLQHFENGVYGRLSGHTGGT